jgi:signal peptidase I
MGEARTLLAEEMHDLVRNAIADVSSAARSLDQEVDSERRRAPQARILRLRNEEPASASRPPVASRRGFLASVEVATSPPVDRDPGRLRRVAVACHRPSALEAQRLSQVLRRVAIPGVAVPTLGAWAFPIAWPALAPLPPSEGSDARGHNSVMPSDSGAPGPLPAPPHPAYPSLSTGRPALPGEPAAADTAAGAVRSPTWRAVGGHATNLLIAAALSLVAIFCALVVGLVITGHRIEQVITGSMQPTIPIGSLVVTERVPVSHLHVGDILVFPNPDNTQETIVHRIVWLNHDAAGDLLVRTKGDYNTLRDSWTLSRPVSADADRVGWILPGAGTVASDLQAAGIIAIAVLMAGGVGWYGVRKVRAILAEDDGGDQPGNADA